MAIPAKGRYIAVLVITALTGLVLPLVINFALPQFEWYRGALEIVFVRANVYGLGPVTMALLIAASVRWRFLPCLPLLLMPVVPMVVLFFLYSLPAIGRLSLGGPRIAVVSAFALALAFGKFLLVWPSARLALRFIRRPWPASFAAAGVYAVVYLLASYAVSLAVLPVYSPSDFLAPSNGNAVNVSISTLSIVLRNLPLYLAALGLLWAASRVWPTVARFGRSAGGKAAYAFDAEAHDHIGE